MNRAISGTLWMTLLLPGLAIGQDRGNWQGKSALVGAAGASANAGRQGGGRDVVLPNDHGQIWRQYDIRAYTSRVTGSDKPQQAIIDWILRETGRDVWFSEPLGFLSASRNTIRVYHTPGMQQTVSKIIERFVHSKAERYVMGLRLVTVSNPNWRVRASTLMRPINVRSPGVEGWLLPKENAALLLAGLKNRGDFREHNAPEVVVHNGQTVFVSRMRPRTFPRRLRRSNGGVSLFETEMGQIQEGYTLQLSPLVETDETSVDAVLKCSVDQVEKLVPVTMEVPSTVGTQRVQLQVPQLVSWRLHERFRWPTNQVLVLSCGVVATPAPERNGLNIPLFGGNPGRADALLFVEFKGNVDGAVLPNRPAVRSADRRSRGF